jgi:hypothetical protein
MNVLPEIAEVFQTSTSFILHGIVPADQALAQMTVVLDELQDGIGALRTELTSRLQLLAEALASVAEETAAGFEALREQAGPPVDGRARDGDVPPSPPIARRPRRRGAV